MIRLYTPADLHEVVNLFTQTIHHISCSYYSSEEIDAWAPSQPDMDTWEKSLAENYTVVLEQNSMIIGFGSMKLETSSLELLYTHYQYQNQGIGSAIINALEEKALQYGCKEFTLITSATAWPFYQKRGYTYFKSVKKAYGDIVFDCQVLHKPLPIFPEVRRKDRLLPDEQAWELLAKGEYGFLAMCAVNGYGYGIPINYALNGNKIYFHCAPQGFKLENIIQNNRVSFCVVGATQVIPHQFSTAYESVLVFGHITGSLTDDEQYKALDLLVEKYSPQHVDISKTYISKSFHRTHILRLDIEHLSGKTKRLNSIK